MFTVVQSIIVFKDHVCIWHKTTCCAYGDPCKLILFFSLQASTFHDVWCCQIRSASNMLSAFVGCRSVCKYYAHSLCFFVCQYCLVLFDIFQILQGYWHCSSSAALRKWVNVPHELTVTGNINTSKQDCMHFSWDWLYIALLSVACRFTEKSTKCFIKAKETN